MLIYKHLHKQLSSHAPDCESLFSPQMTISYFSLPVFILYIWGYYWLCYNRFYQMWCTKFSLFHWLYTQNGLNLFSRWQHSKKMLTKRERRSFFFFASIYLKSSKKIDPTLIFECKKGCKSRNYLIYTLCCGEGGIRTPGASQLNGFQDRRNRPLCHLSKGQK